MTALLAMSAVSALRWCALGVEGRACRPTASNSHFCSDAGDVGDDGVLFPVRELTPVQMNPKVVGYAGR